MRSRPYKYPANYAESYVEGHGLLPEAEGRSSLVLFDELFDPVFAEVSRPQKTPIMSEGDQKYQTTIEKLVPNEKFLAQEEVNDLVRKIQAGLDADKKRYDLSLSRPKLIRLKKVAAEGIKARDALVIGHLRLAAWFVRHTMDFHRAKRLEENIPGKRGALFKDLTSLRGSELEYSDRMQIATLGLINAASKYEAGKASFSTYAMYHMEALMYRAITDQQSPLTVPIHQTDQLHQVLKTQKELSKSGHEVSYKCIGQEIGLPPEKVAYNAELKSACQKVSLDVLVDIYSDTEVDDETLTLSDLLPENGLYQDDIHEVELLDIGRAIEKMLSQLNEREQVLLELRFGIDSELGTPRTLDEVGQYFNLTRERVRQIEARAFAKLRHPSDGSNRELLDFLEGDNPYACLRTEVKLSPVHEARLNVSPTRHHNYRISLLQPVKKKAESVPSRKVYTLAQYDQSRRARQNQN